MRVSVGALPGTVDEVAVSALIRPNCPAASRCGSLSAIRTPYRGSSVLTILRPATSGLSSRMGR